MSCSCREDAWRGWLARQAPVLIAALLACAAARADPVEEGGAAPDASRWSLSGFGTLGVVAQDGAQGLRLLRNSGQAAADQRISAVPDSRLGLQLNWSRGERWDGTLQAVAMKTPPGAVPAERIEWASIGYRPAPDARVRIGRTNADIFLYADSRNVGFALPWARPPVDFYGFAPVAAVDGVDIEQRWSTRDALWRARFTAGSFLATTSDPRGEGVRVRGRNAAAFGLSREEDGLQLKFSYLRSHIEVELPDEQRQLREGLTQIGALPVPGLAESVGALQQNLWNAGPLRYLALGAQYERGPWTVITEVSDLSAPGSPLSGRRGYASLSYRHGSVSYYGLASRVVPKRPAAAVPDLITPLTPLIGEAGALQAQQMAGYAGAASALYRYDQSTVGVGLRWDCLPNAALKLQVDRFRVHPDGAAGWVGGDARAMRGTLYSVVFDFAWER